MLVVLLARSIESVSSAIPQMRTTENRKSGVDEDEIRRAGFIRVVG